MKGGKRKSKKAMRKTYKRHGHSGKKHVKKSRNNRNHKNKRYTMKGGAKNQQLMGNICHSTGYSIGDKNTELKPAEVGLAAGHFAPYTKTQNN